MNSRNCRGTRSNQGGVSLTAHAAADGRYIFSLMPFRISHAFTG
jgi:hypothetical protein